MSSRARFVAKQIFNRGKWLFLLIFANYVASGLAYQAIEQKGSFTSLWWSVVTGFTVGYGDQYPETVLGRWVAIYLIISSWYLSLVAGAYITARVVIDTNEWSDYEQCQLMESQLRLEKKAGTIPDYFIKLPPLGWQWGDPDPLECLPEHMRTGFENTQTYEV